VFDNQKSKMLSGGPLKPGFGLSGAIQQSKIKNAGAPHIALLQSESRDAFRARCVGVRRRKCAVWSGGPLKPGFGLSGAIQQSTIKNADAPPEHERGLRVQVLEPAIEYAVPCPLALQFPKTSNHVLPAKNVIPMLGPWRWKFSMPTLRTPRRVGHPALVSGRGGCHGFA
jgi:hypothetical protein